MIKFVSAARESEEKIFPLTLAHLLLHSTFVVVMRQLAQKVNDPRS